MKWTLVLFFFFVFDFCEGQITFQKTYGGIVDGAMCVQQTSDGGYILAGHTDNWSAGSEDVYLIRLNANGDTMWTKIFGGTNGDLGNSVQQTADGGYIIAGSATSFGAGDRDVYLIKTDAAGNASWTKTYGGTGIEEGDCVQQTSDGGYIITGQSSSFGFSGYPELYLIKTDTSGDTLWTKTYGGGSGELGHSVCQTTDGGYIITGETYSFGSGGADVYLVKTDAAGDTLWTKTYGGTDYDKGYSVSQTGDGGYIIAGHTYGFGMGSYDVYLIKTDINGNTLWTKTFGGTNYDEGYCVHQTTDGGYIIAGRTYSFGIGQYDVYLIKTNNLGDTLWTKTYGGPYDEGGNYVHQTIDGGYVITGYYGSVPGGIYLVKTDSLGNSGCNQTNPATIVTSPATTVTSPATIVTSPATVVTSPATVIGSGGIVNTQCITTGIQSEINNPQSEISIYLNPFTQSLTIKSYSAGKKEILLFDITGKEILRQQTAEAETILNTEKMAAGFYLLKVSAGEKIYTQKLVIQ